MYLSRVFIIKKKNAESLKINLVETTTRRESIEEASAGAWGHPLRLMFLSKLNGWLTIVNAIYGEMLHYNLFSTDCIKDITEYIVCACFQFELLVILCWTTITLCIRAALKWLCLTYSSVNYNSNSSLKLIMDKHLDWIYIFVSFAGYKYIIFFLLP